MNYPSRVMTIAGSAAGGSAGIQADLKTFQELDVYGMSVVTAIVGRHPETNKNVHIQTIEAIEAQFATALKQVGMDGLKTGMLFSKEVIETVANLVGHASIKTIVVDPVMIGKMNSKLLKDDAIEALKRLLIPLATIITPNVPEASVLLGDRKILNVEDLKRAAVDLYSLGAKYVLVKGGRLEGPAVDVLYDGEQLITYEAPRIDTVNTSGAGCTYSAAIAAYLTKGVPVREAVRLAKSFVTNAIEHGFSYTEIVGPTYHAAERKYRETHQIIVNGGEQNGKRALINVDYTYDFVAEDGALTAGKPGQEIEDRVVALTKEFINAGDYTVFAIDIHYEGDKLHPETALFPPHNIAGTPGRDLYGKLEDVYEENKHKENVYYYDKTRYSAFAGTNLEIKLRERGIDEVHIIGVCTDICVLHTAIDAYNKGFKIVIHKDAVASFNQAGHDWALGHFTNTLGAEVR